MSRDLVGLASGNPMLYGYVRDVNGWVDPFGLAEHINFPIGDLHPKTVTPGNPSGTYSITPTGYHKGDKKALYGAAGLKEKYDPSKWISHHVSYDAATNKMKMQLVSTGPHRQNHIGGVKDFEDHHNVKYNSIDAVNAAKVCGKKSK